MPPATTCTAVPRLRTTSTKSLRMAGPLALRRRASSCFRCSIGSLTTPPRALSDACGRHGRSGACGSKNAGAGEVIFRNAGEFCGLGVAERARANTTGVGNARSKRTWERGRAGGRRRKVLEKCSLFEPRGLLVLRVVVEALSQRARVACSVLAAVKPRSRRVRHPRLRQPGGQRGRQQPGRLNVRSRWRREQRALRGPRVRENLQLGPAPTRARDRAAG